MSEPNLIEKNVSQRVSRNQKAVPVALSQNCLKHFTMLLFRQLTACLQLAEKRRNNRVTASEISSSGSGRNLLFQPRGQWNLWRRNDHCNSDAKTVSKFNQCSPPAPGIISALGPRNLARAADSWEKTTHVSPHPHSSTQTHSGNPSAY